MSPNYPTRTYDTPVAKPEVLYGIILQPKKTPLSLTGALSFVGAEIDKTSKLITGTLSFVGNLFKSTIRTVTAALSFIGTSIRSLVKTFSVTGTLTFGIPSFLNDSYSESNSDSANAKSPGDGEGQAFTAVGGNLSSAKFWLLKSAGATGNVVAALYAGTGTFGTNMVGTGSALATSDQVDITTIATSFGLISFTFSGANQVALSAGNYVILCQFQVGGSGSLQIGKDQSSPTHAGNGSQFNSGVWLSSSADRCFYVYSSIGGGNLTINTNKVVSAVLAFIGAEIDKTFKLLTGALSFVGTLLRKIPQNLTGALSFVGATTKKALKSIQAFLAFNITDGWPFINSSNFTFVVSGTPYAGQSFTAKSGNLSHAQFSILREGSPTGNATAILYAHTGTFGTTGTPTGSVLATSDPIDVTTIPGPFNYGWVNFTFSGSNSIALTPGTNYFIVLNFSGGGGSNRLRLQLDSAGQAAGNAATSTDGSFWSAAPSDCLFFVYQGEPLIKKTLKAISAALSFIGTLLKRSARTFTATLFSGTGIGTQTLTDSFNRANETPLAGNWSQHDDTNPGLNQFNLSSNAVICSANGDDLTAWWTSWASGNDQYSQAAVTSNSGGAGAGGGVCVRRSATAGTVTMYRAVVDSLGNYEVGVLVAGSFTSLRTGTVSYVAGRKLGLSVQGTTLKFWYNGVQVGTNITDSSISSGIPGLAYSSNSAGCTLDDWDAGTTGAGPVGVLIRQANKVLTAALSFIGNLASQLITGGQLFLQSVAGTLSFVGSLTKRTGKFLAATLSFIGAIQKFIVHTMASTLNFIVGVFIHGINAHFAALINFSGTLSRKIGHFFTAALSFIGNLFKRMANTKTGTLSFVGTIFKSIQRTLTAILSFIGSLATTKLLVRLLTASLSFVGLISLRTGHLMTAVLSFIGALPRKIFDTETGTLSFVGNLFKQIPKIFAATLSFISNISKRTNTLKTAALSFIGVIIRTQGKFLTASVSFVGALLKRGQKSMSGVLSFIGALPRFIRSIQASILDFVGNLNVAAAGRFFQSLSASLNFTGAITRRIGYHLSSILSFIGLLGRRIPKSLNAFVAFIGSLTSVKLSFKALTGVLSFAGAISKRTGKLFSAVLSFIGQLRLSIVTAFTATISFIGNLHKQISKTIQSVLSFLSALIAIGGKFVFLQAHLDFTGDIFKRVSKTFTAILDFIGLIPREIPVLFEAVISFIGSLFANVPTAFQKLFQATLSFSGYLMSRLGKIIKIFVGTITDVIKISLAKVTQAIQIGVTPITNLIKILVVEPSEEINMSTAANPPEIKIKMPGDING